MHKLVERFGKNKAIKAGLLSDATYPDGKSVAQVAFDNEYGNKEVPPRPFFRNAVNENKEGWKESLMEALKQGFDVDTALSGVGDRMVSNIRESIYRGSFTPNSPVTLLLKERFPRDPDRITDADIEKAIRDVRAGVTAKGDKNKPLQWTGTLMGSITWEIVDES